MFLSTQLIASSELKAILLISSVKAFSLSIINLCCAFSINLLFSTNSLGLSTSI